MAAKQRSVANSVCLNHPERPASTRCDVCFKPVCSDCVIRNEDGSFCSQTCVGNYEGTRDSVDQWQSQRQREASRRRRRRIMMLLILIGLAAAAYWYFSNNPGTLDRLLNLVRGTVRDVRGR